MSLTEKCIFSDPPKINPKIKNVVPQAVLTRDARIQLKQQKGRLHSFRDRWLKVTSDPTILFWIKGYRISFIDKPHQVSEPTGRDWNNDEFSKISELVEDLLY